MSSLVKTIQNYAFQNNLWARGSKIVLGISGGPDSVCLLDILAKLAKKYDFQLHIAHVNYGLRGKESEKDEIFVKKTGKKYGIEVNVLLPKKSQYKGNLENSLRDIRYNYFEEIRKKKKFDFIAVAHNCDDQAETVLMRIIRGSGLNGLSAMKAKSGHVIRPLLKTSRKEIMAYLKQNKLKYRIDKSNNDIKFKRNKIRHKLIPYLEKNFNPRIKKTLSECSLIMADDYAFIEKSAERAAASFEGNEKKSFYAETFMKLHPAIQRQALKNVFDELKKGTADLENKQIEEVIKIIKSSKNKTQKASIGGLKILKKGDKMEISR